MTVEILGLLKDSVEFNSYDASSFRTDDLV